MSCAAMGKHGPDRLMTRTSIRRELGLGRRIGLLGGSFNPAHEGHLHVSQQAMMRLNLDRIWWLVSPQNPLKSASDTAPLEERMAGARQVARDRRILVTDIESRLETRYTIDTLRALLRCFPDRRFVWIMGADNLLQLPRWRDWRLMMASIPVAVFDRAPYSVGALSGEAAQKYARSRIASNIARNLADQKAPAWTFFHTPLHPATATRIRARQG
jgi:nicotinate-nucleotide adenylyltransferase